MPSPPKVLAVLCSDIHLQSKPPLARAGEPDWFKAMKRPLDELRHLQTKHNVPIICAGDIFDYWKSSPELISFAVEHLPKMVVVAGQHDLPYHSYPDIYKSALWTLSLIGRVVIMSPGQPYRFDSFTATGFPWGFPITKTKDKKRGEMLQLAVVHAYCWTKHYCFEGASDSFRLSNYRSQLKECGYNAAVFGDNHKGFLSDGNDDPPIPVLNSGAMMRRRSDEKSYRPQVGLLMSDGSISLFPLNVSQDVFVENVKDVEHAETAMEMSAFMKELEDIRDSDLDFAERVRQKLEQSDVGPRTRKVILESIGGQTEK